MTRRASHVILLFWLDARKLHGEAHGMESENNWKTYWNVVRRYLWFLVALVLATVGTTAYLVYRTPPKYQARERLQVVAFEPGQVSLFSPERTGLTSDEVRRTRNDFLATIQDRGVAWQTIAQLHLNMNADELLSHITLPSEEGEFVTVLATGDTPQQAQEIVTTHVQNALKTYRETRVRSVDANQEFLKEQLTQIENKLSQAEDDLTHFKLDHNMVSLDDAIKAHEVSINSLRAQVETLEVDMARAKALAKQYREAEKDSLEKAEEAPEKSATKDYYVQEARDYHAEAVKQDALAAAKQAAIEASQRMLQEEQNTLVNLLSLEKSYNALERKVDDLEGERKFIQEKLFEANVKSAQIEKVGYLQVVTIAKTPERPLPKPILRWSVVSGVVSLLAGLILVFLMAAIFGTGHASEQTAKKVRPSDL